MSLRLAFQGNQFATIIRVYAPTLIADPATNKAFYSDVCWRGKLSLKRSSRPDKERRNCQSRAPVAAAETILQETAEKVGGLSTRKYRDCTDENYAEIQKLLQVKRSCHTKLLSRPDDHATERAYKIAYSNANSRLRTNAGSIRMKRYSSTPTMVTPKPSTKLCVLSTTQRTRSRLPCALLMVPHHWLIGILHHWTEHYSSLLGDRRSVQEASIEKSPWQNVKLEQDNSPIEAEIKVAIAQLQPGKAPGIDRSPAVVYIAGGVTVVERLTALSTSCWESGKVSQVLKDSVTISLYKNKGDKYDCSNYRGITLFTIAGKILAMVLLDRLIPIIAEQNLSESQSGFRTNRSTVHMIFVLRQLQAVLPRTKHGPVCSLHWSDQGHAVTRSAKVASGRSLTS